MSALALSAVVGRDSTLLVLLQATSPSLAAGVDGPRALTAAPLAPLDGTALTDAEAVALLESGVLGGGGAPATAAAAAKGAVVSVVAAATEPIALGADIWAFHARAAAPAAALSRGVPLPGGGGWHLPIDFSARADAMSPPAGIALTIASAQWTLVGAPAAGLYGPGGALAGAPGGAHTVALDPSASLTATVPAGALRPGYVYRPSVAFTLSARWSAAAAGVSPWDVKGTVATIPTQMRVRGVSFLIARVTYAYQPPPNFGFIGTIKLGDSLIMLPRNSSAVTCVDC